MTKTLTQKELEQLIKDYQDGQFGFQEFLKQLDEKNVLVEDLQQFKKYVQDEVNSWNQYSQETNNNDFITRAYQQEQTKMHLIFHRIKNNYLSKLSQFTITDEKRE